MSLGRIIVCLLAAGGVIGAGAAAAQRRNGFVIDPREVNAGEILAGGPPRDGIPALDDPAFVAAAESSWAPDERVLGVVWNGQARAYPLSILVWHELVNDRVGGRPILVSYCPLCGTGMVFDRRVDGETRRFGVSGLLYRSDLLLYDRETESLWSQISSRAVTGPSQGQRLSLLRARVVPWARWRQEHPETTILDRVTGHQRRYGTTPYGDYASSERLLFPVPGDRRYHPKQPTVGLRLADGPARAYPASELTRAGGSVTERFAGHRVRVAYDANEGSFDVEAPAEVEIVEGYWFAWAAFHPETSVFSAPPAP